MCTGGHLRTAHFGTDSFALYKSTIVVKYMTKQKKRSMAGTALARPKSSILGMIVQIAVVCVVLATVMLTISNTVRMYKHVISSGENEVKNLSTAYATAVSNADIYSNAGFLDRLFKDISDSESTEMYGFVITKQGLIVSETDAPMFSKNDDIEELSAVNSDYAEIYSLMNEIDTQFEDTQVVLQHIFKLSGSRVISICGTKYLAGWCRVQNYDSLYVMILIPYKNVLVPFYKVFISSAGILGLVIAFSVIFARIAAARIARPIIAASERLYLLSRGDLASPSPTTDRRDETAQLLESLDLTIGSLQTYISDIKRVLTAVSAGNLLVESEADYKGDFIELKNTMDTILASLRSTFGEVHKASLSVNSCSSQVSVGTAEMSKNSYDESAAVSQLTESVTDISRKITENAKDARRAREMTVLAGEQAKEGQEHMHRMVDAMQHIKSSSAEIEDIINVIDDIAFQTNILSLNAAVEAARAGDSGRGFAVVADEVRSLAAKSTEAAARTRELIENSLESISGGTELAEKTSASLSQIVGHVENISAAVDSISASADEQAVNIREIDKGMSLINGTIRSSSQAAEKNAAVSQELSGQFEILSSLIDRFRYK